MISTTIHRLHHLAQYPGERRFLKACQSLEATQSSILQRLLLAASRTERGRRIGLEATWDYDEFATRHPVTTYADYADDIEAQRSTGRPILTGPCHRYEPSSGSTQARKWVPYPAALLREFDGAISPWLADIGGRFPGTLGGRHYWSLSWLPDELRHRAPGEASASTDDLQLLPWWKRTLLGKVMAVTPDTARLPTAEAALFQTLVQLAAARDLTLISVWSPTFALELIRRLREHRTPVADALDAMGLTARGAALRATGSLADADFLVAFWPGLALVSAWETAGAAPFARQLRALLPHAAFQGKGLWATEGVVTIPYRGVYPLAVTSHFVEFRNLNDGTILPPWKLEEGMSVQPLLSTGSGFFRYALDDQLTVSGCLGMCPCLSFQGRIGGIDLVGEKLDNTMAQRVLDEVNGPGDYCAVALLADTTGQRPRYRILAASASGDASQLAQRAEAALRTVHHYALARDLGQLDPVHAVVREDIVAHYFAVTGRGGPAGGRKVDPLAMMLSQGNDG
jgi:hypothetical protein